MNLTTETQKPLRICMITTFYPPYNFGGDGIQVWRMTNALARAGHTVHVIHSVDAFSALGGETSRVSNASKNEPGVSIHPLQSRAGMLSPLLTQQTGFPFFKSDQIQEILGKHHFDVIHYHNISLIGPAVLKLGNAIKLYTTHEHWLICPMHVLWKFNREVCKHPTCLPCQIAGKRPPQWWRYTSLLEKSLRHVDCIIAPSRFTLMKHQEAGINRPFEYIPHFVPDRTTPERTEPPHSRPYFFCAGRLEKLKGFQNAIKVFKTFRDTDLLIAGAGDYENELRTMATGLSNVRFLGKISAEDMDTFYERALGVIVPSLCYEVFGLVIVEAFQHRVPAIAHDLGALGEIVRQSNGGLLYTTSEELESHVKSITADVNLRSRLAENGYQSYLKFWTEKTYLEKYLSLVQRILHRKEIEDVSNL